jgi:hypothetical protein
MKSFVGIEEVRASIKLFDWLLARSTGLRDSGSVS